MAANDYAFWARPGSEAANAALEVESSPEKIVAETVEASDVKSDVEAELSAPERSNVELSRYEKQTDFFNSMSGVKTAEQDENELYVPTSLLEVPFNDTAHNLGYKIPKLRFTMSKQTKRKFIAVSSILSCIAVVIAAVIILNSMFGFIPTVKQVPVLYTKGNKVFMTSSTGRLPEQVLFEGTGYQISTKSGLLKFSPNNEDMLVATDLSNKSDTYSLYLRKDMKASEQGKLIDSGIVGDYEFAFSGNSIVYLKSKGTNDLYYRNLSADSSKRIERSVDSFGMLNESTAVMLTVKGTVSTVALSKDGAFTAKEVAKSVDAIYLDSEKSNAFYFIKTEKNTGSGENVSCLFRYSDGKYEKVAENADSLIAYSCADNWAYYSKSSKVNHSISEFIEDDCLEADNSILSTVEGMHFSDEALYAMRRNHLRKNMEKMSIVKEYTSIGYYENGKANELEAKCTQLYAVDLNGEYISLDKKSTSNNYNQYKSGLKNGDKAAIMYESTELTDSIIKLSSIPGAVLSTNGFYEYALTLINATSLKTHSAVISNGKKVAVDANTFNKDSIAFSENYSSFYYIASADANSGTLDLENTLDTLEQPINPNARADANGDTKKGDLMCVNLIGSDNSAQPISVDVERFALLSDGAVIYMNSDSTIFVGSVAIATRAKGFVVNRSRSAVAILGDASDTGARLTIYKEGATKPIADNVSSVVFNDDAAISFVKDYDKSKARGDLYVCRNFGTPTRIDSNVSLLIEYPY